MLELSDFQVGQTVQLQDGRTAVVEFVGNTHFASGDWVGVVLEDATGKNDGAVQGQRYFDCDPGHGMFIRPTTAIILDQPTPRPNRRTQNKANGTSRNSIQSIAASSTRRQSVMDTVASKRQSINAGSPTPAGKGPGVPRMLRSPNKSPTKQNASHVSSGTSTPQSSIASTQKSSLTTPRVTRPSMGPPSTISGTRGQANIGNVNGSVRPTSQSSFSSRASSNRLSMKPSVKDRRSLISGRSQASGSSGHNSPADSNEPEALSSTIFETTGKQAPADINSHESHSGQDETRTSSLARIESLHSMKPKHPAANGHTLREVEDLKTKLRVMEKKRMEDRDKLKALDKIQAERDKFEGIIQKLQSKYKPQQQEVADLRKQVEETETKFGALEKQQAELETAVEVATLDREMAEETAEAIKTELESLKQSHEELSLEVEVLREENQELGREMNPEDRASQGWLQMEKSNERLREALMRLRDMTQEQEADLKGQITELEKHLQHLGGVQEQYLHTKQVLSDSEYTIGNLKKQLDATLGAEEMLEELTDKNLALNEQIESLKATVDDLESLKELNDELEINHSENEKQMQEEIDYSEAVIAEQARKSSSQDQTIQDLEYTVTRFRDLVRNMQSDLEDMRASQQLTEAEANDLNSRSKAMMDLNMRLQASASKAQVKAIDVELGKLEAQESAEHLAIVQHFLPESFKTEQNSVRAMLCFKRIGFKSNLLLGYVKEKTADQPSSGSESDIFACCQFMEQLTWISATCKRFDSYVNTCSLEAFARLEGSLFDLQPVERAFNGWVRALKRKELKEDQCALELERSIAVIAHLVELHITDGMEHFADDVYMRTLLMQSQMESAAAALSYLKATAEGRNRTFDNEDESDADSHALLEKFDLLITQTRSAKVVANKTIRQLEDLRSRSLVLDPSTLPTVEQSQSSTSDFAQSTKAVGLRLRDVMGGENPSSALSAVISSSDFSTLNPKLQSAVAQLQSLFALTNSLTKTSELPESSSPPWKLLAERLRSESSKHAAHEIELRRLKDEAIETRTAIAIKEKTIEEMGIKVEVLEKRVGETTGRRDRLRQLEDIVERARAREEELVGTVNRLRSERNSAREEREKLMKDGVKIHSSADQAGVDLAQSSEASLQQISDLKAEIRILQAAVRHLRYTSYTHTINSAYTFLEQPLQPGPSAKEQKARLRQSESRAVLKEMLAIATDPCNGPVRLKPRRREERLAWRPIKETSRWQVGRSREEWEGWREWLTDVATTGDLKCEKRYNQ
ncbi:MAG: hypothetical protein Q9167_007388 [Letrouitia subvulpina]